jgi:hypothetical protein
MPIVMACLPLGRGIALPHGGIDRTLLGVGQGWLLSGMLGGAGDRSEAQVAKRRAPLIGVY